MLEIQGHKLADRNITSDSLTGIELLIGIDYFTQFITRQKRASGISLFVTRGGGSSDSLWNNTEVDTQHRIDRIHGTLHFC